MVNVTWSCRFASADSELSRITWAEDSGFFSSVWRDASVSAAIFGRPKADWPKPETTPEKSLAPRFHFLRSYAHFVVILRSRPSWILNVVFLSHWENFDLKNDSKDPFNRKASFGNNYSSHLVWTKNYDLESIQERVRLHGANEVLRLVLVFRLLV